MRRALSVMAVLVLAYGVSSQARAEGRRDKDLTGTFEKTQDGKLLFKFNNEVHPVVAGEHPRDDVKKKFADPDKELIGQGTFIVVGYMRHEGDTATLVADNVFKKDPRGDHRDGDAPPGGRKDGGAPAADAPPGGVPQGGGDRASAGNGPDDHK